MWPGRKRALLRVIELPDSNLRLAGTFTAQTLSTWKFVPMSLPSDWTRF